MSTVVEAGNSLERDASVPPQSGVVATLTEITKRYANGVTALDGLTLSLGKGEIVAFLGPNGAGKSTTVKLLLGLSTPTKGSVRIFGQDPRQAAARTRVGAMLQVGKAPEMLRVREHIAMFRGYYPHPMPYADLVQVAGLHEIEDRFFGQLSGGQKQRVLFALALAGDPDLVFLDEPTVGLDVESRRALWVAIRSLAARGKTVLLTTHYLEEADALAHRIVVVDKGRVLCQGTPAEVKAAGANALSTSAGETAPNALPPLHRGVRIVRCATSLSSAHVRSMPGVTYVIGDNTQVAVTTTEPEATLRAMLALDSGLHSLEVGTPALEDAFLALTAH